MLLGSLVVMYQRRWCDIVFLAVTEVVSLDPDPANMKEQAINKILIINCGHRDRPMFSVVRHLLYLGINVSFKVDLHTQNMLYRK